MSVPSDPSMQAIAPPCFPTLCLLCDPLRPQNDGSPVGKLRFSLCRTFLLLFFPLSLVNPGELRPAALCQNKSPLLIFSG